MRPGQTEARQRDAAGGGDLVSQLERERTEKEELRLRVDALQVELGGVGRRGVLSIAISALRVSRPRGRWNGEGRVAGDAGAVRRDPDQEAEGRSAQEVRVRGPRSSSRLRISAASRCFSPTTLSFSRGLSTATDPRPHSTCYPARTRTGLEPFLHRTGIRETSSRLNFGLGRDPEVGDKQADGSGATHSRSSLPRWGAMRFGEVKGLNVNDLIRDFVGG